MHHGRQRLRMPLFEHIKDIAEGRRPMPPSDARYQHYVPQLQLRGFSPNPRPAKNARIWRLEKESGATEEKRVARVGGEPRFNRVLGADDATADILEAWFGLVEHHAAPALDRLRQTCAAPSLADRLTISFFLALQETRTPHGPAVITQLSDMVLNAHLSTWSSNPRRFAELAAEAGVEERPEVIEEARQLMRQPGSMRMKPADARTEAFQLAFATAADRADAIVPMEWTLLRSDEPLVVGDHPVTHHDAEPAEYPRQEPTWQSSPPPEPSCRSRATSR